MTLAPRAAAPSLRRRSRRPVLAGALAVLVPVAGVALAGSAAGTAYASAVIAGTPSAGALTASAPVQVTLTPLRSPSGVAVDPFGNVYIADPGNNEVDKINTSGVLSVVAGTRTAHTPTAGPAASSPLDSPHGVAVDASGNLYIADTGNNVIEKVTVTAPSSTAPSYSLAIIAGTGNAGAPLAGTTSTGATTFAALTSPLRTPTGVAVNSAGDVFVADAGNNQIEKITGVSSSTGAVTSIVAGTGAASAPVPGPATASALSNPQAVAVDGAGSLYIADTGNSAVEKVTSSGSLSVIATTGAAGPTGVTVDGAGDVFVADAGGHQVLEVAGGVTSPIGTASASSSPIVPLGIAIDANDVLYLADAGAHTVSKLTLAGPSAPHITSPAPKPAATGTAYTTTFTATGFPIPTWSLIGTAPTGLTLNAVTGVLSGTPTTAGTTTFTVRASNSIPAHEDQVVTFVVGAAPVAPTSPTAVAGQLGATVSWTAPVVPTGGSAVTGYVVTPSIAGVAGTPVTLSSTATTATLTKLTPGASYTFTVAATNGFGTGTASTATTAVVPYGIPVALTAGAHRFDGSDRVSTAVSASQTLFPAAGSARAVVIAASGSYADALAGARLASADASPLLLTKGTALSSAVATEVKRVLSPTGTIYVLGGTTAVSSAVETSLKALATTYTETRLSGTDRYATAAAIAAQIATDAPGATGDSSPIYLASGANYPDGLAVSALAARTGGVVLLTDGSSMPAATATYLTANDPDGTRTVPVGGPAAVAAGTGAAAQAIIGKDRYDTARLVAARFTATPADGPAPAPVTTVGLATGTNWPDALVGSAAMGDLGGPLLLTTGDQLQSSAAAAVTALTAKGTVTTSVVFGGSTSVADGTAASFGSLISGGM